MASVPRSQHEFIVTELPYRTVLRYLAEVRFRRKKIRGTKIHRSSVKKHKVKILFKIISTRTVIKKCFVFLIYKSSDVGPKELKIAFQRDL